jgi:hypothetical protein
MRKYSLDHGYTCPQIDEAISDAKAIIEDHFYDTLQELNPMTNMESQEAKEWIGIATESLYSGLEPVFEDLRSSNEDLRNSAENQIAECVNELEEARAEIESLKSELEEL